MRYAQSLVGCSAAFLGAVILALAGCASLSSPSNTTGERLGVQLATMTLIEHSGQPAAKAVRVVEAVKAVRTLLDDNTSVGKLRSALLARIAQENPSPAERLAAVELVNALADEIEKRLGAGLLSPDAIVSVNTVLSWVEDAAGAYVPQAHVQGYAVSNLVAYVPE